MNFTVSFSSGTSIREACTEAHTLAVKLNLEWVEFKFNEVPCSISQRCDIDEACKMYFNSTSPESKFKFVIS
jgi:hypothetical protein